MSDHRPGTMEGWSIVLELTMAGISPAYSYRVFYNVILMLLQVYSLSSAVLQTRSFRSNLWHIERINHNISRDFGCGTSHWFRKMPCALV